jgi:hypothetical protein
MRIIGGDLHARQQTLAMPNTTTGEVVKTTLKHEAGQPSLAPISVTRIAIGAILRWTFPLRGALRAYPVPLE